MGRISIALLLLLSVVSIPTISDAQYSVDSCLRGLNRLLNERDFRIDVWRYVNTFHAEVYALTTKADGRMRQDRVGYGMCIKSTHPIAPNGDYGCAVDKACRQTKNNLGILTRMVEGSQGPDGPLLPEGGCTDILADAYEVLDALGGCMETEEIMDMVNR